MGAGEMVSVTQSLSDEAIELIAAEFEREVTIKHADEEELEPEIYEDDPDDLEARPPVVTIMGHVDHGKTSLLDALRESAVVETEAGGITQHIGAYQVDHSGRRITFLDTPGHEAFTALRARGAKVTDIAVLVVAADDGVMPQTVESINHARAAEVPMVVAVNKIDRDDANPQKVRQELVTHGIQPEEWGGDVQFADVSAKTKEGLDNLLERILLVADAELELNANPATEASGPIIESRLDIGRGPVATMLVQRGTIRVGDAIVAGDAWGKVKALHDYRGERVESAGPGTPVEVLGFDKPPSAGELGRVVENDKQARHLAGLRSQRLRSEQFARRATKGVSLEDLFTRIAEGGVQDLNMVVKADVQGSIEAVIGELGKIRHPEVRVNVIHTGIGGITGVGRDARVRVERDRRRLHRAAERRGAAPRRARGRRRADVPRHLPAHRGHRAGARRDALARSRSRRRSARPRCARSSARRGSASSPAATSRTGRSGATRRCASSATAPSSSRRPSRASSASRTTSARCSRASSAASRSRASTT